MFITFNACGFVCDLPIAGVPDGSTLQNKNGNDALGRRVARNSDTFGYYGRSEVVAESSGSDIRAYGYDAVGNRVWSAENALTNTYTPNCLNQYTAITGDAPCYPSYDPDGNMLTNGVWSYAWDAENRMTGAASNGAPVVSNAYDYRHRRVRKATASGTRLFAYDGWNLTAEVFVDSQTGATNVTRYLWGPDLSGTLQGAGGVGGLLAEIRGDGSVYFPCYDANGNVTDYVDAYGTVRGHFVYDAFGNTVAMWGDLAHTFRFRFSTKYWDDETRSYYYGYRHYAPKLGCWLSKDPLGEVGGINQYGFVNNNPINIYDTLGLLPATPWVGGGLGDYAQLITALIDFLNGGPSVTYNFEYPDSVTKRLLKHPDVIYVWNAFTEASCAQKGAGYPKTINVKHEASTLDFFVDVKTIWGVFDVFGNLNTENVKNMDFGVRILGSFGGLATVSVDCNTCEKKLAMTLEDSFTVESMLRNPFNRKPTIKTPFLNPVKMTFRYEIKEKIK